MPNVAVHGLDPEDEDPSRAVEASVGRNRSAYVALCLRRSDDLAAARKAFVASLDQGDEILAKLLFKSEYAFGLRLEHLSGLRYDACGVHFTASRILFLELGNIQAFAYK
jgi:hypothetical protein